MSGESALAHPTDLPFYLVLSSPKMQVSVREARPGDDEAIERVFARLLELHGRTSSRRSNSSVCQRHSVGELRRSSSPKATATGWSDSRCYGGRRMTARMRPTGELDLIYTSPSVWGRGFGRALMASALDRLRSDGYREATLWTAELNARPRRFYEMVGWRLDGARRTKTALGTTFTEVRYRITL